MSAPSPYAQDVTLVTFNVKVNGKAIDSSFQVVSVDTWSAMNKVPKARLVISDGSPDEEDFPISDLSTFLPGNKIEIAAGYDGQASATIFTGVIFKQGLEIDRRSASRLIVDCTDEAIIMTLERKNALFEKVSDGELIGRLIQANGLSQDVATTTTVHEEIVQYYATDWDLMVLRAEMNGLVAIAEAGRITVQEPDSTQAPVLSVRYGESILDLEATMDAATQIASSAILSSAWDPSSQQVISSGPGTVSVREAGNVSSAELADVFKVRRFNQQTGGAVESSSLQAWSSAELLRSKLAKIRGSVVFQGSALAKTGTTLELAGVGDRFSGPVLLSGVHHRIANGEWLTTATFGLSPGGFAAEAPGVAAPGASGQLPPIRGLQTGIAQKVAIDPEGELRVLVSLPLLQGTDQGVWARLGTFYASSQAGAVFFPEAGDELVVGFMNEDPRYPVILGSLYSQKRQPPVSIQEPNDAKAIVTRGGLRVSFDDQTKEIAISTPGGHTVKMDDSSASLSVQDSNGNQILLSRAGIRLESTADLSISARGAVTVDAGTDLSLSATVKASMEGEQVNHSAKVAFSATGSAEAKVTSSGMLTLSGTLVKIN
jgi:Rhs element Vgr protein